MFVQLMYEEYLIPFALLTMRLWLGTTLIIQASDKIFNIGIKNISDVLEFKISHFRLSQRFYTFFAGLTSYLEFIGGILLVTGFIKPFAFALLAINMLLVSIAFSLNSPMWDMRHFFPRFLILIILMLTSMHNDWFSIDWLLNKN